ncbi:hypothetical protein [Tepidibacillus marianensis]|uniref:hypothetical protein n=1 Tax=Tepidibacillus marianensis TaxID=3131995 RepID=UPI0030D32445
MILPRFIRRIRQMSQTTSPAKLIYKGIKYIDEQYQHILTFELHTGKRLTFYVNEIQFTEHQLGDHGLLIFKGEKMINFQLKC